MKKLFAFGVLWLFVISLAVLAQPTLDTIADRSINEGSLLSFTLISSAADNPLGSALVFKMCKTDASSTACTLSTPDSKGASTLTIGSTIANLSNLTATTAQFNWTADSTQQGVYFIRFDVSDSDSSSEKIAKITVNDVAPRLQVSNLVLGGSTQDRSNPRHDNLKDREINVSGTITITNPSNEDLTGLTSSVSLGSDSSRANVALKDITTKVTFDTTTLAAGKTATATVEMRVPERLNAVDNNGVAKSFHVANIQFTAKRASSDPVSVTSKVNMQAQNQLKIDSGRIKFRDNAKRIDNNDNVKNVRPGDTIILELTLENRYKDKEDVSIENIEILVTNDDELNVDESESADDLNPEDTDTVIIEFDIDDDVKKGDEDIIIEVTGEDENGALHGERWVITLEIERKDHEIDIRSVNLNPSTLSCEENTQVSVEVRNTGRRDEEKVYIRVSSLELKYSQLTEQLDLSEDDDVTKSFIIPVPTDTKPGNYRVTIESFYDTSKQSDTDGVIIKKIVCDEGITTPDKVPPPIDTTPTPPNPTVVVKQPTDTTVQPTTPTPPPITGGTVDTPNNVPAPVNEKFTDSPLFIAILVLGYIVVLGGGAVVAIKLLKK